MGLIDRPGTLARIAAILGEQGISINRMRQYGHGGETAPILIVTHQTTRDSLDAALRAMRGTDVMHSPPVALRIERI